MIDTITKICDLARMYGIETVLEQLQPYESNLVCSLEQVKKVLRDVNRDNLKVCLDVVAMEVSGDSIDCYFKEVGPKIVHVHLADSNHQILGEGTYPVETYLNDLEKNNYEGYISLEINDSIYWLDPHSSIEESIEYLNNYNKEIKIRPIK